MITSTATTTTTTITTNIYLYMQLSYLFCSLSIQEWIRETREFYGFEFCTLTLFNYNRKHFKEQSGDIWQCFLLLITMIWQGRNEKRQKSTEHVWTKETFITRSKNSWLRERWWCWSRWEQTEAVISTYFSSSIFFFIMSLLQAGRDARRAASSSSCHTNTAMMTS